MAKHKTATTPRRPRRVDTTDAALLEEFKDFPAIDILERRLEHPELPGSVAIRLKDESPSGGRKWYLRWINAAMPQRLHTIVGNRGYVKVTWDELASKEDIADRHEGTPFVSRGDRGQEILVKMPHALYLAVKRKERAKVLERLSSKNKIREDVAEATATRFGDQAGEFAYDHMVGEVEPGSVPRE